ncbi:MAG: tRNA/rRNA methyltransferase [Bacteroidetes bacterium]|nr:tRNA/rRNA methyltransferase [Bacteroidota bacterium]
MKIIFVLVESAVPENIGAAARAIKTMGFSELRLVNPSGHLSDKAKWLAHGSADILESAKVYQHFDEAIHDIDLMVATTSKQRIAKGEFLSVHDLGSFLDQKSDAIKSVAIVFGKEESGLPNFLIRQCDVACSIPMKTSYPSLNLAQAVMVFAWELSGLKTLAETKETGKEKPHYPIFRKKLIQLLERTEIDQNINLYNRILERAAYLSGDDINLVLSILQRLRKD